MAVVWITGASSGIGRGLALAYARRGATVIATARRQAELQSLAEEAAGLSGRIRVEAGDVTDAQRMAEIVAAVERDSAIDVAVLNSGIAEPLRVEDFDAEVVRRTFDVNVIGTANGLAAIVPRMVARRRGRIAIMGSLAGYGGTPSAAAYSGTKAALINLAASLRIDLDRHNVLIQVINPGFVATPITARNRFPMPFLMPLDEAVERIMAGLESDRFEIAFPRRFAFFLKAVNLLPYRLYFALVKQATGAPRRDV